MEYKRRGPSIILRLDPGDEIVACLTALAAEEGIETAAVQGIGACDEVEVGIYEVDRRHYEKKAFHEEMEMVSLNGNISRQDGAPYLHLHAAFGRADMTLLGGHLNKAVISGTGEIFIDCKEGRLGRRKDERTGLNVFAFDA